MSSTTPNTTGPTAGAEPLLDVRDLRTLFRTDAGVARAVDGVSFTIAPGEVLGVVGESGSGKSVTSLSIMRLIPEPPGEIAASSSIRFKGKDLLELGSKEMREVRGDDIAMIFQEPMTSLNPVYRVGEQIVEALRLHRGMSKKEARSRAIEMLRLVGIPDPESRIDVYPHQLSGGQRQRVMIAIALSCEPDLLIADEPTTALDVTIQAQILDLLAQLRKRLGMAIMLITHDLGVVAEVCDRVIVMYGGQVMEEGPVSEIFANPKNPYTIGLLRSIPRLGEKVERLATIPGTVPSPTDWPIGCRFHTRCPYGWDLCVKEMPDLFPTGTAVRNRCWLEKHPQRRAEVEAGGGPDAAFARKSAPAEQYHQIAGGRGQVPPAERTPPQAPPDPLAGDPAVEEDVDR